MRKKEIVSKLLCGFHTRPTAAFIERVYDIDAEIILEKDLSFSINAKSLMQVSMFQGIPGTKITVYADGPEEEKAINVVCDFFENYKEC